MPLTFPRTMPSAGAERQTFDIARIDLGTPELGGRMTSVGVGFPLWKLELELGAMERADADEWRAFVNSLRGSARTFYARDLIRQYPRLHPGGLGGFSGDATSWSVNGTRDVLTLNLPAGAAALSLSVGDLIGFRWTTSSQARRTMARCVEAAAYASGSLAVTIEPALPALVPSGAVAHVYNAEAIMRLVGDQTGVGAETAVETEGGRIAALQDLRA